MKTIFRVTAISLLALSCSRQTLTYDNRNQTAHIINGETVLATDSISSHIVFIYNKVEGFICTGTLIDKKTVLTAAHCLVPDGENQYQIIFNTSPYDVIDRKISDYQKFIGTVDRIVIHKNYEEDFQKAPLMNQSDIGLMYLNDLPPTGYKSVPVLMDEKIIQKNQNLIMAGFGVSKVSAHEIRYKKNKQFKDRIRRGQYYCDFDVLDRDGLPTCLQVDMNGDGVLRKTTSSIKYIFEHEFTTHEVESSTCAGDSGGPVFVDLNGQLYLAGITSRGSLLCKGESVYTSVPSFVDWIITH